MCYIHYASPLYSSPHCNNDLGLPEQNFNWSESANWFPTFAGEETSPTTDTQGELQQMEVPILLNSKIFLKNFYNNNMHLD